MKFGGRVALGPSERNLRLTLVHLSGPLSESQLNNISFLILLHMYHNVYSVRIKLMEVTREYEAQGVAHGKGEGYVGRGNGTYRE